ncbi:hypothetical protein ASG29_05305 [Sphingomonas sp. Leaf412]|nr:hypothetical protein ASG29_05305 [Sphingomonas sp. Leaf412]
MSLILLTYVASLEKVDALMPAHVEWVEAAMREGAFLVAGRRNPRTGGVILAHGTATAVEAIAATDPFVTGGVATVEVVAFNASFAQPALGNLLA